MCHHYKWKPTSGKGKVGGVKCSLNETLMQEYSSPSFAPWNLHCCIKSLVWKIVQLLARSLLLHWIAQVIRVRLGLGVADACRLQVLQYVSLPVCWLQPAAGDWCAPTEERAARDLPTSPLLLVQNWELTAEVLWEWTACGSMGGSRAQAF